ncbi:MAG: tetratricopeptide repeat protein [Patescibacteria group bacterium]|jgi:tetratricopeptide (TPR) repeat protein|nr:tetratricopeptide repeat protein [Patescibacteria group bacterium]|tara:strand:+ start:3216 stop:5540 length:2325 start_codon:yes stop_codon:yes gene_type:complete
MAFDIAKFGRKPYQKLEQPQTNTGSSVHIRRYFSVLFERLISILLPLAVFAVPIWVWDFGAETGYGRSLLWLVLSGLVFVFGVIYGMLKYELGSTPSKQKAYQHIIKISIAVLIAFSIGSFANFGFVHGFGIGMLSAHLTVVGVLFGVMWLVIVRYFKQDTSFIKNIFVSWFIGSTMLAIYILIRLLFAGGYNAANWVPMQGWLLLFSINVFLLLAFAMFQKRVVKTIWTASIVLHVIVLFSWDMPSIWLLLLGGISALLVFQIVYNKKLWQRNFTYPFQIWIIVLLLLVIPVKIFTGKSVPEQQIYPYDAVRAAASSQGFSLFGQGLGKGSDAVALNQISFFDFDDENTIELTDSIIGHGYVQIYIETGIIGIISWLLLLGSLLFGGIWFLREHVESLKEGSMPEAIYLGAIFWVVVAMIGIGTWFSAFSLPIYWFCMMLFGAAMVMWQEGIKQEQASKTRTRRRILVVVPSYPLFIIIAVVAISYVVFLVVSIRAVSAHRAAIQASTISDSREQLDAWQKVTSANPWNPQYQLSLARARVGLLGTPISIDAQRTNLEQVTTVLIKQTSDSNNPLIHWFAAKIYAQLQSYAEGSAQLGRERYQNARNLWPTNVALPVDIAQYYRDQLDSLVSSDVSASDLRKEARRGLEQALNLEPEYLPARLELAFLLEDDQGVAVALSELELWEEASPEITYHIGRLHFNNGDFGLSVEKFAQVLEKVPSHSNARYSLGIAYFRLEQYDDALTEFQEVLRLNPSNTDVQEKINQVQDKIEE